MPNKQNQSFWQRLTGKNRKPEKNERASWINALEGYSNHQVENLIDISASLVENNFPREAGAAKPAIKAFIIGGDWDPDLNASSWENASGQPFYSGDITGTQQATSITLLVIPEIQTKHANQTSISEEDIRATLRDPEFQRMIVEKSVNAGIPRNIALRIVRSLPDI